MSRDHDFAVVIGVEKYRGGRVPDSTFSAGDAALVQSYLHSLGFSPGNIDLLTDATLADIGTAIEEWLPDHVTKDSKVFVYYSGHGAPDPRTGDSYLVPWDGNPTYLPRTAYPVKKLYASLAKLPASEVVVVLDSCFSGSGPRSTMDPSIRALVPVMEVSPTSFPPQPGGPGRQQSRPDLGLGPR